MNPVDIIAGLRQSILTYGSKDYRENLSLKTSEMAPDYAAIAELYQSLDQRGREAIIAFARLVSTDATSQTLAWVDGTFMVEKQEEFPILTLEGDERQLNGDLQAIWLALEEGQDEVELWKVHQE